jgi:hypothetical protein
LVYGKSIAIVWTELGTAVKDIGRSIIGIHGEVSSLGDLNLLFAQIKLVKGMPDFTRVYGFIDILNHIGGKADVAAISSKKQLELADLISILETGQMLDFIEVKSGDVSITEKGYSILGASPIILKQTLMNLKPFQKLVNLIKQSKTGYITKQELLEYVYSCSSTSSTSGGEDADDNNYSCDFANNLNIVGWGRMALLIDYNSDTETIRLRYEVL